MNISPHHQRPTNYPWPGMASALMVAFGVVMVLIIGFILIVDPFANDGEEPDPAAMRVTATQRF
jgi:hypothetical protein